jgi:hypothetical protein
MVNAGISSIGLPLRFEVLTAMLVSWDVVPHGLIARYERIGGTYCSEKWLKVISTDNLPSEQI